MLTPGDKVNLYYYEEEGQVADYNCLVEQYDNGLLKVSKPAMGIEVELEGQVVSESEVEVTKSLIFNLRSIAFLKAELIE